MTDLELELTAKLARAFSIEPEWKDILEAWLSANRRSDLKLNHFFLWLLGVLLHPYSQPQIYLEALRIVQEEMEDRCTDVWER